MKKNELIRKGNLIYRILEIEGDYVLVIDCIKCITPKWVEKHLFSEYEQCGKEELSQISGMELKNIELLDLKSQKYINEHFALIVGILPFVSDDKMRKDKINESAIANNVSKQTIRKYLYSRRNSRARRTIPQRMLWCLTM